ncbi:unnamed protein product [Moneuplotes crassus]|uniref:Uncharacterized protein n=1 Tax=Euplotes crassus TaxID=5936 RepID=A0AAD1XHU0_EUPCR|nr:unnamed protein product [Moneuplotes crassus]
MEGIIESSRCWKCTSLDKILDSADRMADLTGLQLAEINTQSGIRPTNISQFLEENNKLIL